MRPFLFLFLLMAACTKGDEPLDTDEGDTDSDTDSDADTDSDSDADTDTDSDADTDTDSDSDSDTDTDTDTDTDSDPSAEDCDDGKDNDGDGLLDCEDDDCLDACLEDCDDGEDNDGDGLEDCDDDECKGEIACVPTGSAYTVNMALTYTYIGFNWGPGLHRYVPYDGAASMYGYVHVDAVPDDTALPAFSCDGYVYATPPAVSHGGMAYSPGDCGGCDYRFLFSPSVSTSSLSWYDTDPTDGMAGCLVSDIPPIFLGWSTFSPTVAASYATDTAGAPLFRAQYGARPDYAYFGEIPDTAGTGGDVVYYGFLSDVKQFHAREFAWYAP